MVKQIQFIEEYYNTDDDNDDDLFLAPTYFTVDEQIVIVACLLLLQQRYLVIKSMTPQRIVDEIEDIIDSLNVELSSTALAKVDSTVSKFFKDLLDDYSIPDAGYVAKDTSMYSIIEQSINTAMEQLKGELKQKAMFFSNMFTKDDFSVLPNFKRTVQKIVDAVGNNLIYTKEKTHRNVDEFVYGEDKLWYWLTANDDRVCAWCRMQESLPPRTLKELPYDHPKGRCEREPVDYLYSNEYMLLLARGEYANEIEAFRE